MALDKYNTGLLSVANGSDAVTIDGALLQTWGAREDDILVIPGFVAVYIGEVTGQETLTLPYDWDGATQTDVAYTLMANPLTRLNAVGLSRMANSVRDLLAGIGGQPPMYRVLGSAPDDNIGEEDQIAIKVDRVAHTIKFWAYEGGTYGDPLALYQAYTDGFSLVDINDNELLTFGVVASAVNNFKIANAAAGNAPKLSAVGGDSNISARYATKGTGSHIWEINSIDELQLNATELYPVSDLGLSLGTPSKRFDKLNNIDISSAANLFGAIKQAASTSASGVVTIGSEVREKLSANRTYYVRTDGSDSNNGLANTSGGAFLTIQKAINVIRDHLDLAGIFVVTIQVADGTYSGSFGSDAPAVGATSPASIVIKGNSGTPGNVVLNGTEGPTGTAFASGGFQFTIQDCEVRNTGSTSYGHCLYARWGGVIYFANVRFGTSNGGHIVVSFDGIIRAVGDYAIVGNATRHYFAHNGAIRVEGRTVTLIGTPAFTYTFAYAHQGGTVFCNSTFSGAATGARFGATTGGVIWDGQTSATFLPGDAAGSVTNGGTYLGILQSIRELLLADRTYYVRTDGSDSNDGLANTSGGAFLTIQKAVNVVFGTLDLGGHNVTIQLADGSYSAGIEQAAPQVGAGMVTIQGNATHPENVVVTATGTNAIGASAGAVLTVKDFEVRTVTSGGGLRAQTGATLNFTNMRIGACANHQIRAADGARITCTGNYAIVGSGQTHWNVVSGGIIRCQNRTITISGTPAFSGGFVNAQVAGLLLVNVNTFLGSATGSRYVIDTNSVCFVNGAGASYLPGDAAGTAVTGAQYA